ncbi:helix-turn-helix domain-containing protein [Roseateles hydrophilus]|uniref:helix-turn-helix domain-containing protein n=1 Tax=Roseateles hydrophilus TaxID=2975054 RepID=UPI00227CDACC|nr:helix-turn-helix domain-containing protein [Pelomonas sp. UHG3]
MDTMTISDVAKLLHITEESARNRISAGQAMPPSFRVGRRRLFMREHVEQWLTARIGHPGALAGVGAAGASSGIPAAPQLGPVASTAADGAAQGAEHGAVPLLSAA